MKKLRLTTALLLSCSYSFAQWHVSTGTDKYVLLEQATNIGAGLAPDGHQDIMQSITPPAIARAIIIDWHGGMGGDAMTITGDPFCTGSGYITTYPSATIDRAVIGGSIAQARPWESYVTTRTSVAPTFKVDVYGTYDPATRLLSVTVTGRALVSQLGIWAINAIVVEDSVSSASPGYAQTSSMSATATACNGMPCWWTGLGSPLAVSSYSHMNVARKVLAGSGSIWGDSYAFINPTPGLTNSRSYTYTVPPTFDPGHMKVIGLIQKSGAAITDRLVENAILARVNMMPSPGIKSVSDSFFVNVSDGCSGPVFNISVTSYDPTYNIRTEFGDGTNSVVPVGTGTLTPGFAAVAHSYLNPGSYTIKHVLMNGAARIDSAVHSYMFRSCNVLATRFYYDADGNCMYNTGVSDIPNTVPVTTEIDSNNIPVDTITAINGFYYTALGPAGTVYRMKTLPIGPNLSTSCPGGAGFLYDTLLTSTYTIPPNDFGLSCAAATGYDLVINTTTRAFTSRSFADILVKNVYCSPVSGTLKMDLSPKYSFESAIPPPTSTPGSEITWNLASLSFINTGFNINVPLKQGPAGPVSAGDTVHTSFSVSPTMADIAPASNYINEIDTVNSLYASNYIEVSPASCISLGVSELLFTIGFENVHSDTTRNIFILDTVDNKLDISTLMPVSTSHIMNIYKYTVAEYNIVKFDLPLVTLPDSSQHNRSHGMVQYKIKTRNMTTLGETITARAALNFDNHPVIVTNTVNNTVCDMPTVGNEMIGQSTCSIYPNPTTNELVIGSEPGMFASFSIINTLGQQLLQQETTGSKTIVDVSVLPQGMYYIVLKGENSTVRKFVKW